MAYIGSGSFNSIAAKKELSPELYALTSRVHYYYSGSHKCIVPLLLFPRESPRKMLQEFTNIRLYSSPLLTWHWGWVSNFKYLKLVSFKSCHWRRLLALGDSTSDNNNFSRCYDCGDFDYTMVPPMSWNLVSDTYPVACCQCRRCPTVPSGRLVPQQGPLPP